MDAIPSGDPPGRQNVVAFRLDRHIYALPIEPVVQIVEMVAMTPIPQLEDVVEGVINVHGTAVAMVKLRRHIGLPDVPLQLNTPIILMQAGGRTVGLIVDEVVDVLDLPDSQIIRLADVVPEELGKAPVLRALAYGPDKAVLLLDPENLFQPHHLRALAQATEMLSKIAAEEKPPGESQVPPARKQRKETSPEETSGEPPAETEQGRGRRKGRSRAQADRAETPQDRSGQEAGT
jgi:purine-binding chemotaxis protein CheW